MQDDTKKGLVREDKYSQNALRTRHNRNYLLVIGIDKYQHKSPLNNAVRDAKAFRDILIKKYQFESNYVFELFDQKATRSQILEQLFDLQGLVKKEDNLLIYFSGHGSTNRTTKRGYWIPVDGQKQSDFISNSQIKDCLEDFFGHHIYLIVDSCFSGTMVSRSEAFKRRVESMPSRRVLTSGRTEIVSDGRPGSHSPFAKSLLAYLETQSESISSSQLEQVVMENTPRNANQLPGSSYIYGIGDQGGQFVFHQKVAKQIPVSKQELVETNNEKINDFTFLQLIRKPKYWMVFLVFGLLGLWLLKISSNGTSKPLENPLPNEFEMKGFVIDKDNGKRIQNAIIEIEGDSTVFEMTKTNPAGNFKISFLSYDTLAKLKLGIQAKGYRTSITDLMIAYKNSRNDTLYNFSLTKLPTPPKKDPLPPLIDTITQPIPEIDDKSKIFEIFLFEPSGTQVAEDSILSSYEFYVKKNDGETVKASVKNDIHQLRLDHEDYKGGFYLFYHILEKQIIDSILVQRGEEKIELCIKKIKLSDCVL